MVNTRRTKKAENDDVDYIPIADRPETPDTDDGVEEVPEDVPSDVEEEIVSGKVVTKKSRKKITPEEVRDKFKEDPESINNQLRAQLRFTAIAFNHWERRHRLNGEADKNAVSAEITAEDPNDIVDYIQCNNGKFAANKSGAIESIPEAVLKKQKPNPCECKFCKVNEEVEADVTQPRMTRSDYKKWKGDDGGDDGDEKWHKKHGKGQRLG